MKRKFFGTDGIRDRVGEGAMSPEFVLKLGWAAGRVLADGGGKKVLIGKDTRISGYMFESALEAGLSAAGVDIHLLGPMPTPGIAYLTRTLRASAGIVISASHNPFFDNGIKFFSGEGGKLDDTLEARIESLMDEPLRLTSAAALGKAHRVEDAGGRYIEFCKSTFPLGADLRGMRLALDCANGATYNLAPHVFEELGAEVFVVGDEPDGLNINKDCGSTAIDTVRDVVLRYDCHAGLAFDGDGDRVIMVDAHGQEVDGDELLYIIARDRVENDGYAGGVVGTVMTNLGAQQAINQLGLGFERAKVGDRYVMEGLRRRGWSLGGESSGHIICLDRTTTGDGIVSGLQVLAAVMRSGRDLHELRRSVTKYPQRLVNVGVGERFDPLSRPMIAESVASAEKRLGDRGRVLLRPSGTEPLIRVMVEGEDEALVESLVEAIAASVREAAGSETE